MYAALFLPTGGSAEALIAASGDGTVKKWDAQELIRMAKDQYEGGPAIAFAGQGSLLRESVFGWQYSRARPGLLDMTLLAAFVNLAFRSKTCCSHH